MSSGGVKQRSAVQVGLTFGSDPQKPQADSEEAGKKFSAAMKDAADRQDHQRKKRRGPPTQADEAAAEGEQNPGGAASEKGARPPARALHGLGPDLAAARIKELQARVPQRPKAPAVPRSLAEAKTDPRMPRPSAQDLAAAAAAPLHEATPPWGSPQPAEGGMETDTDTVDVGAELLGLDPEDGFDVDLSDDDEAEQEAWALPEVGTAVPANGPSLLDDSGADDGPLWEGLDLDDGTPWRK